MKLSTKGEYGILAIIDLALHCTEGPVQSTQIAERQGIPKQYLDQLMLTLKKAGMVESSRGRQGGYILARPTHRITLLDIVTALEGRIENANFLSKSSRSRGPAREVLNSLWSDLLKTISDTLRERTLEQLCDEYQKVEKQIMYYI